MKELPCWTIMNCENQACAARQPHAKQCWELVMELVDYRAAFNVCQDCLVHVLKTGTMPFSAHDMTLMANGRSCPLANTGDESRQVKCAAG